MDYFNLSKKISRAIRKELVNRLSEIGYVGDTNTNPNDLKSTHIVDKIAIKVARDILKAYNCNVYMESYFQESKGDVDFTVFIDPIDGSLNWDRGIGDPCIAIAITNKSKNIKFMDLTFAYVEGFRSGDIYFTQDNKSYFINKITKKKTQITCNGKSKLSEAIAYLRPGYSFAKRQFEGCFPIFLLCKDIRAIDNTAIEICEVARNAADIIVEARRESDFFNLLAYPILRNAGGILSNLNGNVYDNFVINVNKKYDYIACNNTKLLNESTQILRKFAKTQKYVFENIKFEF